MKHLTSYELGELCLRNKWFTCGTSGQYDKLLKRNEAEASIEELSIIIWTCSDNITKHEIYSELLGAMMNKTLI